MDKNFIDDIVLRRKSKKESFKLNFPDLCTKGANIEELAEKTFRKKHNLEYFQALMEEVHHQENKMISWNKEISEKHLVDLIEHLEEKVYKEDNTKMSVLNTIVNSIKELNIMNGLDEVKINVKSDPIKIIGFNNLKSFDDNGNIIDGEIVEPKQIEGKDE